PQAMAMIPLPEQMPLWPQHKTTFDNYFDGHTKEQMRLYEDPIYTFKDNPYAVLTIKSLHTRWRDYGYRLPSRFAHQFYLPPPVQVCIHFLCPGLPSNYDYAAKYRRRLDPFVLDRTAAEISMDRRMAHLRDGIIVGAEEMLRRAGDEFTPQSHRHFILGKHLVDDNEKYLFLNLEHDSVEPREVTCTVDIDSVIWTTRYPKVKKSVTMLLTPTVGRNAPISKSNHGEVYLLFPPTEYELERNDLYSWDEVAFSHSVIPHARFASAGPFQIYIAFPRMVHRDEHSGRRQTIIPMEVLTVFWNSIILAVLRKIVPSSKAPYVDYSVEQFIQKMSGKTGGSGAFFKGYSRVLQGMEFNQLISGMHEMMDVLHDDDALSRFASFFFVVEAKGIKLETQQPLNEEANPWKMLTSEHPQLDWDYMLDHANGELLVDLAVSFHPVSTEPLVGLWRLDAVDASFGIADFNKGKVHHANTLNGYGSLSAPMSKERSRRTHILHRMSYNLCYEAIRPKDNQPYLCSDGDAYNLNDNWRESFSKRIKTYSMSESKSFGVRDEYRIGGMAVEKVMSSLKERAEVFLESRPILWMSAKVWFQFLSRRLQEIQAAQITLYKNEPSNYGIITGLLMYMARASESTPTYVPRHTLDSLQDISAKNIMERFGMLFLHDLDIHSKDEAYFTLQDQDTADVLASMGKLERRKPRPQAKPDPLPSSDEYPLGSEPTLVELRHIIHHEPWKMMTPFVYLPFWSQHEEACRLFILFTGQMFLFLSQGWFINPKIRDKDPLSLEDAMNLWTPSSLYGNLTHVSFRMSNAELTGPIKGQRQPSFRKRMNAYFPPPEEPDPTSKQWQVFCKEPGFIAKYRNILQTYEDSPDNVLRLRNALGTIFQSLQCIPSSNEAKPWKKSSETGSGLEVICNATYYKLLRIGRTSARKQTRQPVPMPRKALVRAMA
ncbi:hypothetical protein DENSPDRAFT_756950, partial [Dentipellis sp. KUC8613]